MDTRKAQSQSSPRRALAYAALVIGATYYLFEFVARVAPSLAVDQIAANFGLSNDGFGTLASTFFWIYAPMQIAVGLLLDRYGARPLALIGSLACAAGFFIFTATSTPFIGAVGRMLTGFGASFAFVGALYVVNHWFPPERFAFFSGAVNAIGMIGTAIGSVFLTALIGHFGWRDVFFAIAAFGVIIFLSALLFLRDAPDSPASTRDPLLGEARSKLAAVAADRRTWLIALLGMLYYTPINVFGVLWGNDALTSKNGLTSVEAETAVSMMFWGMAAGSVAFGWISDAIGHRKWLVIGGAAATACAFCPVIYLPLHSTVIISALLFLVGFFAGGQMLTFALAKESHGRNITGTIVAFVNMIGIGGAMIFQPLTGYLLEATGRSFPEALTIVPIALAITAAMAMLIREQRHPDHAPTG